MNPQTFGRQYNIALIALTKQKRHIIINCANDGWFKVCSVPRQYYRELLN